MLVEIKIAQLQTVDFPHNVSPHSFGEALIKACHQIVLQECEQRTAAIKADQNEPETGNSRHINTCAESSGYQVSNATDLSGTENIQHSA